MAKLTDKIVIHFEPKGDKGLVTAIKSLDRATKSLLKAQTKLATEGKKVEAQHIKTARGVGVLDTKSRRLAQNNKFLANSFATIRSKLLLLNFAMALGARQLARFTQEASKLDSMSRAFNTLAGGSNKASIAMTKLQKATNKTMTQFDLFQQANNAMILGVSTNSDEMAEMFDIQTETKQCSVSIRSKKMVPEKYFKLVKDKTAAVGVHKDLLNKVYSDNLPDEIQMGDEYNSWRFNILVEKKEKILKGLFNQNLFASSHFKPMSNDRAAFKTAYDLHDKVINLFNDFYYTEDQAYQTCNIIKGII